ncbi:MAG: hypothetical protein VX777_09635 [Chlamydiota bacterium]|nr:hypothetical protein [Chlamydiota bacterium]
MIYSSDIYSSENLHSIKELVESSKKEALETKDFSVIEYAQSILVKIQNSLHEQNFPEAIKKPVLQYINEIDQEIKSIFELAVKKEQNPFCQEIQNTFSNVMYELLTDEQYDNVVKNEFDKIKLSAQTFITMIIESEYCDEGIVLLSDKTLTSQNCPQRYDEIFKLLLMKKRKVLKLSKSEQLGLLKYCNGQLLQRFEIDTDNEEKYFTKINNLRDHFYHLGTIALSLPDFNQLFDQLLNFSSGKEDVNIDRKPSEPTEAMLSGVTIDLIRTTFYNHMAKFQSIQGIIPKEDLLDGESYIFLALPAFAFIEVLRKSKNMNGGICLAENKVLTLDNCPEKFEDFAKNILGLKKTFQALSKKEIKALKYSVISEEEIPMPEHLIPYKTNEVKSIASHILQSSIEISQDLHFKGTIQNVIDFCLGAM